MSTDTDLRQAAIARLRKKRDLQAHALAYLLVNLFLTGIWLLTGPGGFFWPMFPMFGWGIGLSFHAWDVLSAGAPTEQRIRREVERLAGTRRQVPHRMPRPQRGGASGRAALTAPAGDRAGSGSP